MYLQKVISRKTLISFLLESWRSLTKKAGSGSESVSGSISQRHGSADPDPNQNATLLSVVYFNLVSSCYCISVLCHRITLNVVWRWWRLPGGTWTHWNPLWTSRSDSYSTSWPTLGNIFVCILPFSGSESILNFYISKFIFMSNFVARLGKCKFTVPYLQFAFRPSQPEFDDFLLQDLVVSVLDLVP